MVGWLQHGSILHGLNPQITPKDSQAVLTSQNTTKIHQDSPSDTPRHPQTASDTIGTAVYIQSFKVVIWCVSIWGAERRWSHHTILAKHWNARFFLHLSIVKYWPNFDPSPLILNCWRLLWTLHYKKNGDFRRSDLIFLTSALSYIFVYSSNLFLTKKKMLPGNW